MHRLSSVNVSAKFLLNYINDTAKIDFTWYQQHRWVAGRSWFVWLRGANDTAEEWLWGNLSIGNGEYLAEFAAVCEKL